MNRAAPNSEDICDSLGSALEAGKAWLTPLREAYREECGALIFLNYVYSLLGVAQAQLEHSGVAKLTGMISANFDLARLEKFSDAQLDTADAEIYLDFPDNWRFAVCCFKTEESPYPVCRCCLYGPEVTYYYPPKETDAKLSYVSLEKAVAKDLIFAWLREAVQTYMQEA